ncbi:hypothetical protein ACFXDE_27795 [Kitasatospora sp. NPDC059408]|uniref:hypothetical protein n=1 Tax=Kitasatospora sp. NPDC059408 TaxID=3346823 RepID=UPI003685A91D
MQPPVDGYGLFRAGGRPTEGSPYDMPFFKRKAKAESNSSNWQDHPAARLQVGMTRDRLVETLGPPTKSIGGEELLGGYGSVSGSARAVDSVSSSEYMIFEATPSGYETWVVLQRGAVVSAQIKTSGTPREVVLEVGEPI